MSKEEYPQGRKLEKPGGGSGRVKCETCGAPALYVTSYFYYCETHWRTPLGSGETPEQLAMKPVEEEAAGHFVSDKHANSKGARRTKRRIGRVTVTVIETVPESEEP